MAAFILVEFTPLDPDKLQEYAAAVPATLAAYDAQVLVRGAPQVLTGESPHAMQLVLQFPSRKQALAWYESPDYQALIPLRDAAMATCFKLID